MDKKENKAAAILGNLDIVVASIILAILIVLTFLGVVWRYIFNAPFTWLEEVQTSCMVWIVFAGAGAAFRSGNHVAIEMIVDLMPKSMQKIMVILISIVVVVVIGYLFMQSIGFIQVFVKSGRSTSMLKIPYSWVYGIAIVSYFDMIISYFYALFHGVKSEAKEAASSNCDAGSSFLQGSGIYRCPRRFHGLLCNEPGNQYRYLCPAGNHWY